MTQQGAQFLAATEWHPRSERAYRHWLSIHPASRLPGRQHLDPIAIPPDILPGIWLLDVQREPFRLKYRLAGTSIITAIGREVTGAWLDEAHPHITATPSFFERYRDVVFKGEPSLRRGPARLWNHRDYAFVESLLLPLAADGQAVDMLMAHTVLFRRDGSSY